MMSLANGQIKAGLDSVRGAKLRSLWTMLGVIIGVASVITVVGIGNGVKNQVGGQIHHLGQNLITIRPAQLSAGFGANNNNINIVGGVGISGPLSLKDIDVISHTKGVAASAPLTVVGGQVRGEQGVYRNGFVIGTTSALPGLLNQSMAYGAFFEDGDNGTNTAVLGQRASEAMFNEDVPLGRSFSFHGQQFIVRGIFNQFSTTPLSQQADFNNAIFIPNDVAESLSKNTAPTYEVLAQPASGQQAKAVAARLRSALDQTHGGQSGLAVQSGNQNLAASDNILALLTKLIAGAASISLLVGGIGIMNVMLVSVSERMHEIGIRKAVGATNRQILNQFLIEAGILSLAGGILGIVLAFVIDLALRVFTSLQPSISWQVVLLASGVSLLIGVVFGTIPAIKAAYKHPIEALRSE
jgi:putative ABC transport system permease protein